jgi:hypothetical protein
MPSANGRVPPPTLARPLEMRRAPSDSTLDDFPASIAAG